MLSKFLIRFVLLENLIFFQDFRSAALQGNVVAVKNCLRQLQNNPIFPIDKKFCGKTLVDEASIPRFLIIKIVY